MGRIQESPAKLPKTGWKFLCFRHRCILDFCKNSVIMVVYLQFAKAEFSAGKEKNVLWIR